MSSVAVDESVAMAYYESLSPDKQTNVLKELQDDVNYDWASVETQNFRRKLNEDAQRKIFWTQIANGGSTDEIFRTLATFRDCKYQVVSGEPQMCACVLDEFIRNYHCQDDSDCEGGEDDSDTTFYDEYTVVCRIKTIAGVDVVVWFGRCDESEVETFTKSDFQERRIISWEDIVSIDFRITPAICEDACEDACPFDHHIEMFFFTHERGEEN